MHLPDFYQILGISDGATFGEIKAAFRRLALKYHPDKNPGDKEAIEIFSAIYTAYAVLSNPEKRKKYDSTRAGTRKIIVQEFSVRSVVDRAKIRIMVGKRVLMTGEPVHVLISIFEKNNRISVSGLHRFDVMEGPVINSLFPPGADFPEVEIAYVLIPKDAGYIEIGPASFISNGTKYLSESVYIKVNPPHDLIKPRPASGIERIQSATVSALIVFYSFLIGYNVYQFKIFPFMGDFNAMPQRTATPLALGDFSLTTGDSPYESYYGKGKYDNSALNRVIFRNSKSHDAVVMLADINSGETVRNNYIRAGDDFIMQHIPDGKYYLKVLFGNDWNDTVRLLNDGNIAGGFKRDVRYEIFRQEINVIQMQGTRSGDTLGYRIYEITLYPVPDGNARSITADTREFFN